MNTDTVASKEFFDAFDDLLNIHTLGNRPAKAELPSTSKDLQASSSSKKNDKRKREEMGTGSDSSDAMVSEPDSTDESASTLSLQQKKDA